MQARAEMRARRDREREKALLSALGGERSDSEDDGGSERGDEQRGSGSGSDDDMPPLLEDGAFDPELAPLTGSNTAASAASAASTLPVARFAFNPSRARCVADYSCCLRYKLTLATCCMPNPALFSHVPSFSWLQSRFVALHADESTLAFLRRCDECFYQQGWVSWWGVRVGVLKPLLRKCMAHTNVNGLLGCGRMFLTSGEQVRTLLHASVPSSLKARGGEWPWASTGLPSRLLDIGAGDGHITSQLAQFFSQVVATEVADQMIRRLRERGFVTVQTGDLDQGLPLGGEVVKDGFDLVTLFNVLDRCMRPLTLLRQIRSRMRAPSATADGTTNSSRLLLSVPLPLDASVEVGTRWVDPVEPILPPRLSPLGRDFESGVCALAERFLELGFNVECVSRVPYLSEGDTWRPFYVLDASLWLLSARQEHEPTPKQQCQEADPSQQRDQPHAHEQQTHAHGPSYQSM